MVRGVVRGTPWMAQCKPAWRSSRENLLKETLDRFRGVNERRGLQERFEAARGGRLALSAILIWSLFCIAVTNLPEAYLRNQLSNVTQRYLNLVGLNQFWGV